MLDEAPFAAAEAGALSTPEEIQVQADRLLSDSALGRGRFRGIWLHLDRLTPCHGRG